MPLSHLTVIEFAGVLAGPSVGMFLAELGARVIKIENPAVGGDVTRGWTLGSASRRAAGAPSPYFASVNWGKESVGLDFSDPDQLEAAQTLSGRGDIVLVSYRTGAAARFGLDYESVAARNPAVVYGEITAYGPDDPRPGYDAVIQGETGFMHLNGTADSGPLKLPIAMMDLLAGHQLKQGILLALLERERSGKGARVSVSLVRAGLASLSNQASNWLVAGVNPPRLGSAHPNIVPYGTTYRTRDGGVIILAVGTERQFRRLCEVLGCPGVAEDPRFASNAVRLDHRDELDQILADRIAEFDRDPLLSRLGEASVPAGPIYDVAEALGRPAAEPLLLRADDPAGTELTGLRTVALEPGGLVRPRPLAPPPRLGAHTEAVLEELT